MVDELKQQRKQLEEGEWQYMGLLKTKTQLCIKHRGRWEEDVAYDCVESWGGGKQLHVGLYSLLHEIAGHRRQIQLPEKRPQKQRLYALFMHFFSYLCICLFVHFFLYFKLSLNTNPGPRFTSRACSIPKAVSCLAAFQIKTKSFTVFTGKIQITSKIGSSVVLWQVRPQWFHF